MGVVRIAYVKPLFIKRLYTQDSSELSIRVIADNFTVHCPHTHKATVLINNVNIRPQKPELRNTDVAICIYSYKAQHCYVFRMKI